MLHVAEWWGRSLSYLTYPTRVMFKSSKVIPVMLASVVIAKRRYSLGEYAAAFLLVVGITMFTLADKVRRATRAALALQTLSLFTLSCTPGLGACHRTPCLSS